MLLVKKNEFTAKLDKYLTKTGRPVTKSLLRHTAHHITKAQGYGSSAIRTHDLTVHIAYTHSLHSAFTATPKSSILISQFMNMLCSQRLVTQLNISTKNLTTNFLITSSVKWLIHRPKNKILVLTHSYAIDLGYPHQIRQCQTLHNAGIAAVLSCSLRTTNNRRQRGTFGKPSSDINCFRNAEAKLVLPWDVPTGHAPKLAIFH